MDSLSSPVCSLQLQRAPTTRYLTVQQSEAVLRQQFVSPKPGAGAGMSEVRFRERVSVSEVKRPVFHHQGWLFSGQIQFF